MTRIGIFGDDEAVVQAALLLEAGLAQAAIPVAMPGFPARKADAGFPSIRGDAQAPRPSMVAERAQGDMSTDGAANAGQVHISAFPLTALQDGSLLEGLTVAITVGRERSAAERAFRAARFERAVEGLPLGKERRTPAWFLACTFQGFLLTEATLASRQGPALPYGVRTLPMAMPRLEGDAVSALVDGVPSPSCARVGILLAALALAAGADPDAWRIEPDTLADLMADTRGDEPLLGDRLVSLANAFENLQAELPPACPPQLSARRRKRTLRLPRQSGSHAAVAHTRVAV